LAKSGFETGLSNCLRARLVIRHRGSDLFRAMVARVAKHLAGKRLRDEPPVNSK